MSESNGDMWSQPLEVINFTKRLVIAIILALVVSLLTVWSFIVSEQGAPQALAATAMMFGLLGSLHTRELVADLREAAIKDRYRRFVFWMFVICVLGCILGFARA